MSHSQHLEIVLICPLNMAPLFTPHAPFILMHFVSPINSTLAPFVCINNIFVQFKCMILVAYDPNKREKSMKNEKKNIANIY